MTIGEWLDGRMPAAPPVLRERVRLAIGADVEREAGEGAAVCLASAERLLDRLLAGGGAARRADAVDLLAADALVTYAFEAASEEPESLAELARGSLRRIATIGEARAS